MVQINLQKKILVLFLFLSIIPLLFLLLFTKNQVEVNAINQEKNDFQVEANHHALLIQEFILERQKDIQILSKNPIISSNDYNYSEKLVEMQKFQEVYPIYDDITFVNPRGVVLASTTYHFRGEWKTKKYFIDALSGKHSVSDAHLIPNPAKLVQIFAVPVIDADNVTMGVIVGQLDLNYLWNINDLFKKGETGYLYILNDNNRIIADLNKDLIFSKTINPIDTCESGLREYTNQNNQTVIEAYAPMLKETVYENRGCWKLVLTQNKKEVLKQYYILREQIITLFVLIVMIAFFLSIIFSRSISKPILKLSKTASKVAKGNLDCRVNIQSNDEIGMLAMIFNNMISELKSLDLKKEEFISIAAHELKTPITSIKGFAQLMSNDKFKLDEQKRKRYLKLIIQNTNRLYNLVDDLIDSSRLSLGKLPLNIEGVNVKKVIKEIKDNLNILMYDRDIIPVYEIEDNIPLLKADYFRLIQVLKNLIINAINFSEPHSKIIIKCYKKDKFIQFEIMDQGKGIPKDKQKFIFTKFFQVDSSLSRKVGGSGLGLSISKGLIDMMGGEIWFTSDESTGSNFKFKLPIFKTEDIYKNES